MSSDRAPPGGDARRLLPGIVAVLAGSGRPREVLDSVVELVLEATGADACFLHRWDEAERRLRMAAASRGFTHLVGRIELAEGEGVAGWVARHRMPVVITRDKWNDPRYKYIPELGGDRFTSMVSLPATSPRGRLQAVLNLHTVEERSFPAEELEFLTATAALVGAHLETEELIDDLLAKEERLAALVRSTLQAQEAERRRVATEIHDGVTQLVVAAHYRIEAARHLIDEGHPARGELEAAAELVSRAEAESRRAIADLRPSALVDLGLVPAVAELVSRARSGGGFDVELRAPEALEVSEEHQVVLYRVLQEALRNVAKHAGPCRVEVELEADPDRIRMTVADDGRGFDVEAAGAVRSGASYGLVGMAERVDAVGGALRVASAPGRGSRIDVSIPR